MKSWSRDDSAAKALLMDNLPLEIACGFGLQSRSQAQFIPMWTFCLEKSNCTTLIQWSILCS